VREAIACSLFFLRSYKTQGEKVLTWKPKEKLQDETHLAGTLVWGFPLQICEK
jgi:hypothetical protein